MDRNDKFPTVLSWVLDGSISLLFCLTTVWLAGELYTQNHLFVSVVLLCIALLWGSKLLKVRHNVKKKLARDFFIATLINEQPARITEADRAILLRSQRLEWKNRADTFRSVEQNEKAKAQCMQYRTCAIFLAGIHMFAGIVMHLEGHNAIGLFGIASGLVYLYCEVSGYIAAFVERNILLNHLLESFDERFTLEEVRLLLRIVDDTEL